MKNQLKNLKAAAKQPVFIHFWMGGSIKSLESQFFRKFQIFSLFFIFFQEKLKKKWNLSKFEKSNAKSLKIAAKPLVFLHFLYLGTAKSNEELAEHFENSSKTVSLHPFLNGWQQKNLDSQIFQTIYFFQKFLKKNLKVVTIREKQRKKFENSSETPSFPQLLVPGNCQK